MSEWRCGRTGVSCDVGGVSEWRRGRTGVSCDGGRGE